MFHLNGNTGERKKGEEGFNALRKIRPLLNTLVNKFKDTYYPEEAIIIDKECVLSEDV